MAFKITATVVVKRKTLAREGVIVHKDDNTSREWAARRVWAYLTNILPAQFIEGLVVTVEEVNKQGETHGLAGVADSDVESF